MNAYFCKVKTQSIITLFLILIVYLGGLLTSSYKQPPPTRYQFWTSHDSIYAGSFSCRACHKNIYDSFVSTAHNLASLPPSANNIKGSFDSSRNHFRFNQLYEVVMEKEDSLYLQKEYIGGALYRQEQFDIVIGSGRKGQTYMYWANNVLFQLPISYYTPADSWCNSPGYPKNSPFFERMANGRCIECHGSYARLEDSSNRQVEYFDKTSVRLGIDCERCHGPSENHVLYHTSHPEEKKAKYIFSKTDLSRQQKLDACALCHAGIGKALQPPFAFKIGDRLADYYAPKYNVDSTEKLDVHGNQYGLLTSSKCFKNSAMNCSSCHDVHQTQINQPAVFSAKCMNCHNSASHKECTVKHDDKLIINLNCIDCHMPLLPSKAIFLQLDDAHKSTPDFVRTHRIAIYPEVAEEYIRNNKLKNGVKIK